MKTTICDVCKKPIAGIYRIVKVSFPPDFEESNPAPIEKDWCMECVQSPVILSEMRRTRTRRVKAKPGRPRGKAKKEEAPSSDSQTTPDTQMNRRSSQTTL